MSTDEYTVKAENTLNLTFIANNDCKLPKNEDIEQKLNDKLKKIKNMKGIIYLMFFYTCFIVVFTGIFNVLVDCTKYMYLYLKNS